MCLYLRSWLMVVRVVAGGLVGSSTRATSGPYNVHTSINKTKYLMILGIHKSIKTEFKIK